MAARGFCQHGKVWTTCPICGKEVIAAAAKKGLGSQDEFVPYARPKKKAVAPRDEDAAPEAETEPPEEPET